MKKIQSNLCFLSGLELFLNGIVNSLENRLSIRVSKILVPQSFMCYRVDNTHTSLQLKLIMIPFKNGDLVGRLSWLDQHGNDHICCYINRAFDCVMMQSNGCCFKQTKNVEQLCLQCFESLLKESN